MLSGLDSSVLNDELKKIFGFYGEIKEVSCSLLVFPCFSCVCYTKIMQAYLNIMSLISDL